MPMSFPGMPPMGGGGPGGPGGDLSSPEMQQGAPSPERNTLLASPLADRIGGGLQQQQGRLAMMVQVARKILQAIANMLSMSDPKAAADIEKFAAQLMKIAATANVGPGKVPEMASALQPFPQGQGMGIPSPPGGTGAFAGPLAGMMGGPPQGGSPMGM